MFGRGRYVKFKHFGYTLDKIQSQLYAKLGKFSSFRLGMKMMSLFIGKECGPIFAQRITRGYHGLQLHSSLWENSIGCQNYSKRWLIGFIIYSLCQPIKKSGKIEESELLEHMHDLDFIHELTAATVVCPYCKERLVVDKKVKNVKYCHCPNQSNVSGRKIDQYSWVPFMETSDLIIWRQPHPEYQGLYAYKVYGYYNDISPEEFLDIQLDISYRKKWDDTARKLEVVEENVAENSAMIYWEMKWPTMFSNRDYVFARRYLVDKENNTIIIMNRAAKLSSRPEQKSIHRVTEYWSVMQINAVNGLNKPGVEFGLTYFDNPGVTLPTWLTNWAAMTGIPDFLNKQRNAARQKRKDAMKKRIPTSHYSDLNKVSRTSFVHQNTASATNTKSSQSSSSSKQNVVKCNTGSDNKNNGNSYLNTGATTPSKDEESFTHKENESPADNDNTSSQKQTESDGEILSQFFKNRILQTL